MRRTRSGLYVEERQLVQPVGYRRDGSPIPPISGGAGLTLDTTINAGAGFVIVEVGTTATPITTVAISTAPNCRLVALCASNTTTSGVTHTVSGGGLGWTKEVTSGESVGSTGIVTIHHAFSVAGLSSQTISLARGGSPSLGASMTVIGILGAEDVHGGAENVAVSSSGTPSCAVTSTRDGSFILSTMADWAQKGDADVSGSAPAQTLLNTHNVAGEYSAGQARSTNTVSIGTQTMGFTIGLRDYRMAVIEIREVAGGGGGFIPVPPPWPYGPGGATSDRSRPTTRTRRF